MSTHSEADTHSSMHFFDANCMVGRRADRRADEPWSVEDLVIDMEHFGIQEALVSHAASRDYDALVGNSELVTMLRGHSQLHPVWTIVPPSPFEISDAADFVRQAKQTGVKAFNAYPLLHNFSMSEWCIGPLLDAIESAEMPLLLPFSEISWESIFSLCQAHPRLPVIVHTVNYRQLRFLIPLWQHCPKLFVDISWFSIVGVGTLLQDHGLLDRLVFGSNYPVYTPGAAVTMVSYAEIPLPQKRMIAGDTLRSILNSIND